MSDAKARKRNKIKLPVSTRVALWIGFGFFVIYGISLLFPLLWCVYNSFKLRQEFLDSVWALPKYWYIENWYMCLQMEYNEVNILEMFGNTIIFTVGCTFVSTFFSMATAYVLTKYPFRGSGAFYSIAFILMMIPMVGNTAAMYKLYHEAGMYNTYWGPILASCGGFGMGFVLLYGFFKNISWTYAEAAFLDGAGHFTVFLKIMVPMAMPAITAIAIQGMIGIWNEYYTFYMYAPEKVTIALGLYGLQMQNSYGKISYPQLFAAMTISTIPVIIVYAFAQKFIIKNTTLGGLKG
ncbi:MAG: carbohydrate ABC transporter permease [Clostridia bacterium]|nr:carbohydrate ABC transporter permease [Clostridia bacterium]